MKTLDFFDSASVKPSKSCASGPGHGNQVATTFYRTVLPGRGMKYSNRLEAILTLLCFAKTPPASKVVYRVCGACPNLWGESIGTVFGIIRARSTGKPVILVDPNYIVRGSKNPLLREIVGEEPADSLKKAADQFEKLSRCDKLLVDTRKGQKDFNPRKLVRSVGNACQAGGISDSTVFPVAVSKGVEAALRCSPITCFNSGTRSIISRPFGSSASRSALRHVCKSSSILLRRGRMRV
jgi:hypothetical protein